MTIDPSSQKLKALPVQLIEIHGGAIVKRGCTEVKIVGDGVADALRTLLAATRDGGATSEEICKLFDLESRPSVRNLIEHLLRRELLMPSDGTGPEGESVDPSLDIFYWHFGDSAARAVEQLNRRQIAILGANCISRQLASTLDATGFKNFQIVDHPLLRNLRLFDDAGRLKSGVWPNSLMPVRGWTDGIDHQSLDCLVITSDFGNNPLFIEWNKFCVEHDRHFLPVVLQNLIGYVGPLVVPYETACFNCLLARQNANLEDPQAHRAIEDVAFEGQVVVGFHHAMAAILGDIAAFELTNFYGGTLQRTPGTLIEVNMLAARMTARKVLKIPRCAVCSPLNTRPSITPKSNVFTPIKEKQRKSRKQSPAQK